MDPPQFLKSTTILPVADIDATRVWYGRVLGLVTKYVHCSNNPAEPANYAILARDAIELHFILDEGGPVWTRAGTGHLSLTVSDVEAVYADVVAGGVLITRPLAKENWPARGFEIADPSGNSVHLEQPV